MLRVVSALRSAGGIAMPPVPLRKAPVLTAPPGESSAALPTFNPDAPECLAETGDDNPNYDAGSFRDRDGRVCESGGEIYRLISAAALDDWRALQRTEFFQSAVDRGALVATREASEAEAPIPPRWIGLLHHERVPLVSYPYEWSFGMLRDAAVLQLDLLSAALAEGLNLKDGSSYNVQWRGVKPVFIDVLSFQRFDGRPFWPGYRQFCQLFLNPLLLQAWRNIAFQPLLRGSLEGITPRQCLRMLTTRDLFRRGALTHVLLHSQLESLAGSGPRVGGPAQGPQAILHNVRGLKRMLAGLEWRPGRSTWSHYAQCNSYAAADRAAKREFVATAAAKQRRRLVFDLGANTGEYALLAAESAELVVALDADSVAVERMYQELRRTGVTNVQPLVFDLADPSPGLGWRNRERRPLEERGRPDLVLSLAVMHHLVLGRNLPLVEVLDWFAGLSGELVIEFVDLADPMVRQMLANRRDVDPDYTLERFESLLQERFRVARRLTLPSGTRTLFHAVNAKR